MNLDEQKTFLKHLSSKPGIYRMYDAGGEVIYVGKANNLKNRVRSYFNAQQSSKTQALVAQIDRIEVTVTSSEKEALLLETTLIKSLRPKYNILMRDDKSFPYIYVQQGHLYPKMKTLRLAQQPDKGYYFGPYPNASSMRATLHLLQTIFKLRDCQDSDFAHRQRPCLQYQIKRCSAPCVGLISAADYQTSVNRALSFLQGKTSEVFAAFQARMQEAAATMHYEEAAQWRDKIKLLRRVQEQQAMIRPQGDLDVIDVQIAYGQVGVIRVVVREGRVLASDVSYPQVKNMDWYQDAERLWQDAITTFISDFYRQAPQVIPALLLVAKPLDDAEVLTEILTELGQGICQIQVPKRGEKKAWLDFAHKNLLHSLEAEQKSWMRLSVAYQTLAEILKLEKIERMEAFDISHTQGELTVASCVVFDAHGPLKKDYRRFNIEGITPGDDYAAMRQVLERRAKAYQQNPSLRPDLLVIDGGLGQVRVAQEVLGQTQVILGIAKGPSRKAGMETLILADARQMFQLDPKNPALHLLQHLRDEAHRFAITLHRQKRQKRGLDSSLLSIPGIGPVRRRQLLQFFGGIHDLSRASIEEIAKVPGINLELAGKIFAHFHA